MLRQKLFGNNIEPSCSYCQNGTLTRDGSMILCEKQGVVDASFSCRRFSYAPLKRVPRREAILPTFDKSDFEL